MRIMMLGWEYPPLVSGGLATATEGFVNGLIALGHEVVLVLPYYPFKLNKPGLVIVSPEHPPGGFGAHGSMGPEAGFQALASILSMGPSKGDPVSAWRSHYDYVLPKEFEHIRADVAWQAEMRRRLDAHSLESRPLIVPETIPPPLFHTIEERAFVVGLLAYDFLKMVPCDVVHAHDWITFFSMQMLAERTALPLVAHIHSTEFDRAGEKGSSLVMDAERHGLHAADRVITVSEYTRSLIVESYGVPENKIDVIYNASNEQHTGPLPGSLRPSFSELGRDPVVTFVGRITFQKGPAYFVHAAQLVLEVNPDVKFCVVGVGDLLDGMRQLVWELGIDSAFKFMGFLDAQGVQQVLQDSDVFVMPSVSEPFGIVALEAVQQQTPVIISRQSGVAEVLPNALKVDFWDTELLADRILSVLKYDKVRREMILNSQKDLVRRTWHQAAIRCEEVYQKARQTKQPPAAGGRGEAQVVET